MSKTSYITVPAPCGAVRGRIRESGVEEYLGIPYATAERFCPPKPVSWNGRLDCLRTGPRCLQTTYTGEMPIDMMPGEDLIGAEDCLTLNIWAQPGTVCRALPVIVYIHGGAFQHGSNSNPSEDGGNFIQHDPIIFVSVNYRLGALGFLQLSDKMGEKYRFSGNCGCLDVIEALRWIYRNIEAFGGNPNAIFLAGISAGAKMIGNLITNKEVAKHVHGIILESGATQSFRDMTTARTVARDFEQVVARMYGIGGPTASRLPQQQCFSDTDPGKSPNLSPLYAWGIGAPDSPLFRSATNQRQNSRPDQASVKNSTTASGNESSNPETSPNTPAAANTSAAAKNTSVAAKNTSASATNPSAEAQYTEVPQSPEFDERVLLTMPAEDLIRAQAEFVKDPGTTCWFGPVVDGELFPLNWKEEWQAGRGWHGLALLGSCAREMCAMAERPDFKARKDEILTNLFGDNAPLVQAAYDKLAVYNDNDTETWVRVLSDFMYRSYTDRLAQKLAADGNPTWVYTFQYGEAHHGMGFHYLMHNLRDSGEKVDPKEMIERRHVARQMRGMIRRFVTSDTPEEDTNWAPYNRNSGFVKMVFDAVPHAESRPRDSISEVPLMVYSRH